MMTDEDLKAAKALVDAATPGPWEASGLTISPTASDRDVAKIDHWPLESRGNAAFIAASRTLVPKLLAEVERLRAENAQHRERIELAWLATGGEY